MTLGGAIADLKNLMNADDIPFYYKPSIKKVIETIEMDAKPIVKGKWVWELADNGWANSVCSVCGYTINHDIHCHVEDNYCSNCGADMRGEENE